MSEDAEKTSQENNNAPGESNQSADLSAIAQQLESMTNKINEQSQFNQAVVDRIQSYEQQQLNNVSSAAAEEPVAENFYDLNPSEYKKKIREEIAADLKADQAKQLETQATLANLIQEYPEANQQDSDMYKKFIAEHKKLNKSLQDTSEGYELAAIRAANSLGVLPMSKRSKPVDDGFTVSSGGNPRRSKDKNGKVTDKMDTIGRLMGLDMDDPKQKERLEKRAERTNWRRYK